MYVCVCARAFECVRSGKKNTADSHLAMDRRLHFFSLYGHEVWSWFKHDRRNIKSRQWSDGATGRSHTPTRERPLVSHFSSYRTGLRNNSQEEPGKRKSDTYLIWRSEYPNSHLLSRWVCSSWILARRWSLWRKKNASPSLFFSLKWKQEKRRSSLKALAGSDEIDKSVSRVSPNLTNLRSWNPKLERTFAHCPWQPSPLLSGVGEPDCSPPGQRAAALRSLHIKLELRGGKSCLERTQWCRTGGRRRKNQISDILTGKRA